MDRYIPNVKAQQIREGKALPELLAPAGSYRALQAAIDGGADAIYMGGAAFNARINAKNFTPDEIKQGIALAHAYGAKVYITANTLIYDRELDDFLRACEDAYLSGADALIVADIGAAHEIRKRIPIELHASTQVSGHGAQASLLLADAGFSRMVCAREMSARDIRSFIDNSPLEAEVFVHGALCVSHSGQCLFSSLVGGRSGNRGECAQPCRLPYKVSGKETYPLSLKDLSLAMHIPELIDMGVCSLKIEGRMKSPEYVREVTRIWRRLLDERRAASAEDMRRLDEVFSRGGFTDGYFTERIGKKMLGVRSEEQKKVSRELVPFTKIERKLPIDIKMTVRASMPAKLTLSLPDGTSVSVIGDVPQAARTAPIDEETVKRSLLKLGDTPYAARNVDIDLDEGLMMPISALNAIRREAVERLIGGTDVERVPTQTAQRSAPAAKRKACRAALFYEPDCIPETAYEYFDILYTPLEKYTGSTNGVALPSVIFDSERESVRRMLADAKGQGAEHVLIGNLGHLSLANESGLRVHGDIRLNAVNSSTVARLEGLGIEDVVLLPELTLAQMRDIGGKSYCLAYGRAPLMITEKCVGKESGGCDACNSGRTVLTDRKGIKFPVKRTYSHRSIIFNSVPFYMADKSDALRANGLTMLFFVFSTETKREAAEVIEAYKKQTPPKVPTAVKRIK